MIRTATSAVVLAFLAAAPTLAQQRTLEPGDRVRVSAPALHPGRLHGEVVRYLGDTLTVREAGTDRIYALPLDGIRGLARNEGVQRGRSVRRGLVLGAFVGAAVGLVTGPFLARDGEEGDLVRLTVIGGAAGLAAGSGVGALMGSLFAGDQWQRYSMPGYRAARERSELVGAGSR